MEVTGNDVNGIADVGQPGRIPTAQRGTASASTSSRRSRRSVSGVPISTFTPSASSRSQPSASRSSGLAVGSMSTSRSASLSAVSPSLTTLPNTRTFDACRFAVAAKIAARQAATRSPNGDRGIKLPAMVTRLLGDETEKPSRPHAGQLCSTAPGLREDLLAAVCLLPFPVEPTLDLRRWSRAGTAGQWAITVERALHLTGVLQVVVPPGAVRWWTLQARRVSPRPWRRGWDLPWPLTDDDLVVSHGDMTDGELEHPV